VTKADKADFAQLRLAARRFSLASLARQIPGRRRAWLVFGHGDSLGAAQLFDTHPAMDTPTIW
jgi:hypothetical protein